MDNILRFDAVKFVTKSEYISNINGNLFKHVVDITTGEIVSVEFHSNRHSNIIPFELYIRINYESNRMTVEFSSKILLADYRPNFLSNSILICSLVGCIPCDLKFSMT